MFKEKIFKCQTCDKIFSSNSNFNQHMKTHDDLKVFKCDVCFKTSHKKSNLVKHYWTYTG